MATTFDPEAREQGIERRHLVDRYQAGDTVADLADDYGLAPATIRRVLADAGVEA